MELKAASETVTAADLAASSLFSDISSEVLAECARRARGVQFPRGALLAREGDSADAFYVLLDGRVEVTLDEQEDFVDVLGRGDCVGDLALLLRLPRTATVRALNGCRAARISAEDFDWILRNAPGFAAQLARTIGGRLQRTTHRRKHARPVERIAIVAACGAAAASRFKAVLEQAITPLSSRSPPSCFLVSDERLLDPAGNAELQDADAVLFLADKSAAPDPNRLSEVLRLVAEFRPKPRVDLVLLHDLSSLVRGTLAWLRDDRLSAWHHVRLDENGDVERLARRLLGQAVGLVLSGGGARGFAHIGVLKAFAEASVPVDFIAGASMGAVVAAQHAMGYDSDEMLRLMRRAYVEPRRGSDFTLPFVAIHSGAGSVAGLKAMFGAARMEDLPTPCFTVSSNLSTAESVVHMTGRLWYAVRSSSSVPGLVPPVRSRRGFLVDGGILDNLPAAAMRERCGGRVVASDVSVAVEFQNLRALPRKRRFAPFRPPARMPSIRQILMRTVQLASVRDSRIAGVPADLYLRPPVGDVGMTDFHRLDEIVERGAVHAREQLAGWRR